MISASKSQRFSLADVLPSCLAALTGASNRLALPSADKVVVVLADGLGVSALRARSGHARTLAPLLAASTKMSAGFPTTTASSLATLSTGQPPGQHGLVGYSVLDPGNDRVVNQLSGWDERIDPFSWQRCATVFELVNAAGIPSFSIGAERYSNSGFTHAILRGSDYRAAESISDRFAEARRIMDASAAALVYLYVPELDQAGHAHGWESPVWTDRLEILDSAVREFAASLTGAEGMILTADHGVLDVAAHNHVLFDTDPGLIDGIRHIAGEPRCLQLHFQPDATQQHRDMVVDRWRSSEGSRSLIATRSEAIAAGWFGDVDPVVAPRIGDLLIAAKKQIAYYDSRAASQSSRSMIGQHGSFSAEETAIPFLRFGAFAKAK